VNVTRLRNAAGVALNDNPKVLTMLEATYGPNKYHSDLVRAVAVIAHSGVQVLNMDRESRFKAIHESLSLIEDRSAGRRLSNVSNMISFVRGLGVAPRLVASTMKRL